MNEPMFRLDEDRFGAPRRRFVPAPIAGNLAADAAAKPAAASGPAPLATAAASAG